MRVLALVMLFAACAARAQTIGNSPPPPRTEYEQFIGAQLPLSTELRDEHDRAIALRSLFGTKPVVLLLGYYHCPNLCQTVAEGALEALAAVRLDASDFRVVMVSIDTRETAAMARAKHASYDAADARWKTQLVLLRGDKAAVASIARAAGFHYRYDAALDQYVHPAGLLVAGADGRISRYFLGVRFPPRELELALLEAGDGRLGSPVDRLLLICSHYDPAAGRYSVRVMWVVRAVAAGLLVLLAAWLWRYRRRRAS